LTPYGSPSSGLSTLNDGNYVTNSWAIGNGSWVAYHLKTPPTRVVVAWNNPSYVWSDYVTSAATTHSSCAGGAYLTFPSNYQILTSSNSTNGSDGTWTNRLTVTGNEVSSRSHVVATGGDSWIKLSITSGNGSLDEFDVYDASNSADDTWLFLGTSISANTYKDWAQPSDFQKLVEASSPGNTPAVVKAGIPCILSTDMSKYITNYLTFGGSNHFWAIEMGTNDAWGGSNSNVSTFTAALQLIIDSAKAHGIQPMIARTLATDDVPGFKSVQSSPWQVNQDFLTAIDNLTEKNGLVPGPDLYTYFVAHPTQHLDGVHPDSTGAAAIQRLWAQAMLSAVYTPAPVAAPVDKMLLEAENGQLAGGAATVSDASRSNGAYVNLEGGSIVWIDSLTKAGTYNLVLNMDSPFGPKTNTFAIDGDSTSFTVDSSVTFGPVTVATAVTLQPGKHSFTLNASWGWINVDYLQLVASTTGIRNVASAESPKAYAVPGGIQATGLVGIRQIRAMDVSGNVLASLRPSGSTAHIPLSAHGMILLSFEDASGVVMRSMIVRP
jgi:lysophospholipase L1-like esterase